MKKLIVCLLLVMCSSIYAQSYFSKVYEVKIKGRDTINLLPNFLLSIIEKDSFVYGIGYSADTSYKNNEDEVGIAFYQVNKAGVKSDSILEMHIFQNGHCFQNFYTMRVF